MWFSAAIFERFRGGARDFYDVMFEDGGSDSECGDGDEEQSYGSNENLTNVDSYKSPKVLFY